MFRCSINVCTLHFWVPILNSWNIISTVSTLTSQRNGFNRTERSLLTLCSLRSLCQFSIGSSLYAFKKAKKHWTRVLCPFGQKIILKIQKWRPFQHMLISTLDPIMIFIINTRNCRIFVPFASRMGQVSQYYFH